MKDIGSSFRTESGGTIATVPQEVKTIPALAVRLGKVFARLSLRRCGYRHLPSLTPQSAQYLTFSFIRKPIQNNGKNVTSKAMSKIQPVSDISLRMIGRAVLRQCGQRKRGRRFSLSS